MTDRGRRVRAAPTRLWAVALATLLALAGAVVPAAGADDDPDLDVRITSLTPTRLAAGSTVRLRGTVTNHDDHAWRDAQAYLVIARTPYTSRATLADAIKAGQSYTGTRIVRPLSAIDEMGTIAPGSTTTFDVRVPYSALGITGGAGVHPVGVQVLATDADGTRSNEAVGRATTFLPTRSKGPAVPTGVLWPFLMPDRRSTRGDYVHPDSLVEQVSSGRLRHQLDLARSTPSQSVTVGLDPALLMALEDLLHRRHTPKGFTLDAAGRRAVTAFRDDLVSLARGSALWVIGFDRPDLLALSESGSSGRRLIKTVDRATTSVMSTYSLEGRRANWTTGTAATTDLLEAVRRSGREPAIVTDGAATDWRPALGSVVSRGTPSGTVPLFVNHSLDTDVPGSKTPTTLRQRLVAEATFSSLDRTANPDSRADAIAMVDPSWDPGEVGTARPLADAFDVPIALPTSPDALLSRSPLAYRGHLPASSRDATIATDQITRVDSAMRIIRLLASAVPDSGDLEDTWAVAAGSTLGQRWRTRRADGLARAQHLVDAASGEVAKVSVEGPPAFTLSSSKGSLPLTISNKTAEPVRLDVRIDSTNPALSVPSPKTVTVGPGERRTIDVAIDMGEQSSSTLSAQLVTPSGTDLGQPSVFNIRSSRVGTAVWVAMGLAVLLVVVAVGRRFLRRGGKGSANNDSPGGTDG